LNQYVKIPTLAKILKCSNASLHKKIKENKISNDCVMVLSGKRNTVRINLEKMVENYPETFEMVEQFNMDEEKHDSRFISISEFAEKIGVTHITGWRYVVHNKVPHVNLARIFGKKIFIDVQELLKQNPALKGHFAN
jgi:predicted DNA-binding transcriptional regulator AlpA